LVASYAWVAFALSIEHISQILCNKWAFSVVFDTSTDFQQTSWVDVVATPLWPSVGVKPNTWQIGSLEPSGTPDVQSLTARPKTPCIGVFLMSLKRSWNVDIENGLALEIRTSAAQVMGKRRAGNQTGSLTPDH
jgi:hypothetical protein